MMRGRGRESKKVSGPVEEEEWRPGEGRGGTGGSEEEEELRIRLGMVAKDLMKGKRNVGRVREQRRGVDTKVEVSVSDLIV